MAQAPTVAPVALAPQAGAGRVSTLPATRVAVAAAVLLALVAAAFVAMRHYGIGASSRAGCVVLTASSVRSADCGGVHDGRITTVLQQTYDSCPPGSDEYDVTDNTGNLCIDRSDSRH